jgi:hypothetical protein
MGEVLLKESNEQVDFSLNKYSQSRGCGMAGKNPFHAGLNQNPVVRMNRQGAKRKT